MTVNRIEVLHSAYRVIAVSRVYRSTERTTGDRQELNSVLWSCLECSTQTTTIFRRRRSTRTCTYHLRNSHSNIPSGIALEHSTPSLPVSGETVLGEEPDNVSWMALGCSAAVPSMNSMLPSRTARTSCTRQESSSMVLHALLVFAASGKLWRSGQ